MSKQTILCVSRKRMETEFGGAIPLGFSVEKKVFEKVTRVYWEQGVFLARTTVENDPAFLQAIVYGIVSDGERILGLWRKERQSTVNLFKESRLNNKIGLAAGGHVEPADDIKDPDFFHKAMLREFSEELNFTEPPTPIPAGIIMYEETLIDRVHLGLIYKVMVKKEQVRLAQNNEEYDKCGFLRPDELTPLRERMEGWGKVIADAVVSRSFLLRE